MKNKAMMRFSLLVISIFLMSHLAIAPAIPKLYDYYHAKNPSLGLASVESLVTVPAMMITITVLLSNLVVSWLGTKRTVLLGLGLIGVFGALPTFLSSFPLIFICRLLLGVGIGLYNSLSISLISDFYEGEVRAQMIGLRTAFLNIGKALTTFIAGYALLIGVNYTFLVYLLAFPVLILFYLYVPESSQNHVTVKEAAVWNRQVALIILLTFLVGISYIGATIKIPSLLVTQYGFLTTLSSQLLTILAFSGIITGCFFGPIVKKLGDTTLFAVLIAMGLGNLLFTLPFHLPLFILASILVGMSFVGIMSFQFYYISRQFPKGQVHFVTSLAITGGNIGVVLTPVFLTKLLEKFQIETFITPFYISSALMALACVLGYSLVKKARK
ncbi:MFS transporter [Streptococcus acidominimus]|uniref:MFS transporter n=1 Tax=Streptococcus acidominimus TaxID=1326 RepID=A0A1Q8EA91_STRAI|nr:MFS transporter [Streptococcus acidominimus]MBF0846418.1 MFS transporter [Streptococcus danieliae]MBF0819263.1 MFS transporter [Streptococcus acidominimus]MBF0838439.1 MFS transporter [Streptococcus acidominimus]OLF48707.1 MFS transporter [Streptococcus acidominimus]TFU30116.1 MFS transporter [Streptococcus acidominimus]